MRTKAIILVMALALGSVWCSAEEKNNVPRIPLIGETAPAFKANKFLAGKRRLPVFYYFQS
ncbi:MAG: hypothetical protein PHV59_10230, partial [Victivallales bacterium]|nr:hypothetical protein [Victivallales bacterium]